MSKIIHPLYWNEQGFLNLYSISYVFMALFGSLSFLYSKIPIAIGIRRSIVIGVFIYSIGLSLRAFPVSYFLAALSGAMCGMGSILIGLSNKFWLFKNRDDESRPKLIAQQTLSQEIGKNFGIFSSGIIVTLIVFWGLPGEKTLLLLSPVIILFSVMLYPKESFDPKSKNKTKEASIIALYKAYPQRVVFLLIFLLFLGIESAILIPMLPLYIKDHGFSTMTTTMILAVATGSGTIAQFFYSRKITNKNISTAYFFNLSVVSLSTYMLFMIDINTILFITFLITMIVFKALSGILFAVGEYRLFPKKHVLAAISLIQTTFIFGDMIGGMLLPYFYKNKLLFQYNDYFSIYIFINGLIFVVLTHKGKQF